MRKLKLTINETKTSICTLPEGRFDFLGYTLGRCYSPRTGRAYIGTRPSTKAITRIFEAVREMTSRQRLTQNDQNLVDSLNRKIVGWANYFVLGSVVRAYRRVDNYVRLRLRQWLCGKHKTAGHGTTRFSYEYLERVLGLVRLEVLTRGFPWANA